MTSLGNQGASDDGSSTVSSTTGDRVSQTPTEADAIGSGSPSRGGRAAVAASGWLAWLTVVIAALGFAAGTPRAAGPDEPMQQATAWYYSHHLSGDQLVGSALVVHAPFPEILTDIPCYALDGTTDAGCLAPRSQLTATTDRSGIYNYPRIYYLIVGAGQVLAQATTGGWQDVGGRAASAMLNLGVLTLLGLWMRRTVPEWGTYLLVVAVPMAAFLWTVVNPSGWEITMAMVFAYALAATWWVNASTVRWSRRRRLCHVLPLGVIGIVFAFSRPAAFVWMVGLTLAVVAAGWRTRDPRLTGLALAAVAVGVLAGVARYVTNPMGQLPYNPIPIEHPSAWDYLDWLVQSLDRIPERLHQMIGVLGWLDTPMIAIFFLGTLAAWLVLLTIMTTRGPIPSLVLLTGGVFALLVPSILEASAWNDWPGWWQGRYTLPFVAGFLLLLLVRYGTPAVRAIRFASLLSTLTLAWMVVENVARYAFGIDGAGVPVRWSEPALPVWRMAGAMACALVVVALGLARAMAYVRDHHAAGLPSAPASAN